MESIVDKLASSYRDIVEETLTEDGVSEEQRAILLNKFVSIFTDKIRLGMAYSFGKETNGSIRTEISPEDALQKEEALLRAARRRKRYPAKGAKILQSVCSTNRKSLKDLKATSLGKHKLELSEVKENDRTDEEFYESAAKKLKTCQSKVTTNMEKSKRIAAALKMIKNAEYASSTREAVDRKSSQNC